MGRPIIESDVNVADLSFLLLKVVSHTGSAMRFTHTLNYLLFPDKTVFEFYGMGLNLRSYTTVSSDDAKFIESLYMVYDHDPPLHMQCRIWGILGDGILGNYGNDPSDICIIHTCRSLEQRRAFLRHVADFESYMCPHSVRMEFSKRLANIDDFEVLADDPIWD